MALRLAATSLVLACLAACPTPRAPTLPVDDTALRIEIAQLEASRAAGLDELGRLAASGPTHQRVLALRGLGRGGQWQPLIDALGDRDPEIVAAAAAALGVAASLDEARPEMTAPLIGAIATGGNAVIEALGRAGDASAQPALIEALSSPRLAEQAALALGRHGRRKIPLDAAGRSALAAAAASKDPVIRYAAVYALSREHEAPADPAPTEALVACLGDAVAEIRAQAIAGLGRRKALAAARALNSGAVEGMLLDRDARVAVEAVRALADTDDGKDAIAAVLSRRVEQLVAGDSTMAHVILESEKLLAGAASRPVVASALQRLAALKAPKLPALTAGWIQCLALAGLARGQATGDLDSVGGCALPDALRLPLVADLVSAGSGSAAARQAAMGKLLAHPDPRVHAATVTALPALVAGADHTAALAGVAAAIASKEALVVGAGVEVLPALAPELTPVERDSIDQLVIARATDERDPELGVALLDYIAQHKLEAGKAACRNALTGNPVLAKSGLACLRALGDVATQIPSSPVAPPPADVATVINKVVRWRVTTSRGEIVIRLAPEVAPWATAVIVQLTQKKFYDGLAFHRVVPNFVVQGGDPTESGAGGPGFAIPAEPATLLDGAGYLRGGVGIADAGRDTGGSQWFIMHSRAPHLDGRYTWFGAVESGQAAADALLVGDRVIKATIEIGAR